MVSNTFRPLYHWGKPGTSCTRGWVGQSRRHEKFPFHKIRFPDSPTVASRCSDWVFPATSPVWRRLLTSDTRENNANCTYKMCRSINLCHTEETLLFSKSAVAVTFKIHVKFSYLSGLAYSERDPSEFFLSPTWHTAIEPIEPVMKVHPNCLQLIIRHPQYQKLCIFQYR
jgi:hypothetical protein